MDESARLRFFNPLPIYAHEKPFFNFTIGDGNLSYFESPALHIHDIRGKEETFKLAVHGFEYRHYPLDSAVAIDWASIDSIKKDYVSSLPKIAEDLLGEPVLRSEMFDFRVRNASAIGSQLPTHPGLCGTTKLAPAVAVHVDQTPLGVVDWLRRELGPETDKIVQGFRVRVLNIWRPLVDVVEDYPLTMCDCRTVEASNLVEIVQLNQDYPRRNYLVTYNEGMRFHYLSRMTKNEICAFIVFDSKAIMENRIAVSPHTAFRHSEKWRSEKVPRESIEVRLLVLTSLDVVGVRESSGQENEQ